MTVCIIEIHVNITYVLKYILLTLKLLKFSKIYNLEYYKHNYVLCQIYVFFSIWSTNYYIV